MSDGVPMRLFRVRIVREMFVIAPNGDVAEEIVAEHCTPDANDPQHEDVDRWEEVVRTPREHELAMVPNREGPWDTRTIRELIDAGELEFDDE